MLKEFREFIDRGNVVDLAVAFILGVAFTAIVNSLVDDIIMPIIGLIIGGLDFSGLSIMAGDAVIAYGNFIQAVINFLLIAFVLFLIVRASNRIARRTADTPPSPPELSSEEKLLTEIRDLLRDKQ